MFNFISSQELWTMLHLFAMTLGLGGATYTDFLLFRFLKDFKISEKEAGIIRAMSKVILVGLALAIISGVFLFIPSSERLLGSSKFLSKVWIFLVLLINGLLLHFLVLPKLIKFSFLKDHFLYKKMIHLRHLSFAMGAVSVISWYSVFILGSLRSVPYTTQQVMTFYCLVLAVGISCSLLCEKYINSKAAKAKKNT